jgi:hypothetical protein
VRFPLVVYKKLKDAALGMADLLEAQPTIGRSLQQVPFFFSLFLSSYFFFFWTCSKRAAHDRALGAQQVVPSTIEW